MEAYFRRIDGLEASCCGEDFIVWAEDVCIETDSRGRVAWADWSRLEAVRKSE